VVVTVILQFSAGLFALGSLLGLSRALPLQNIAAIAFLLGLGEVAFEKISGVHFVPLFWIGLIVCARALGKWMLRPWRQNSVYGFWLIGVAALITTFVQFTLQVVSNTRLAWGFLIFRFAVVCLLLVVTAPWYIQKRHMPAPV
jgi:hypothetical protein